MNRLSNRLLLQLVTVGCGIALLLTVFFLSQQWSAASDVNRMQSKVEQLNKRLSKLDDHLGRIEQTVTQNQHKTDSGFQDVVPLLNDLRRDLGQLTELHRRDNPPSPPIVPTAGLDREL